MKNAEVINQFNESIAELKRQLFHYEEDFNNLLQFVDRQSNAFKILLLDLSGKVCKTVEILNKLMYEMIPIEVEYDLENGVGFSYDYKLDLRDFLKENKPVHNYAIIVRDNYNFLLKKVLRKLEEIKEETEELPF